MEISVIKLGLANLQKTPLLATIQEGQIVRGFVQNREGKQVIINSGGLRFVAQTDLELTEGQPLWLKAVTVSPEKLVFRLVNPETNSSELPGLLAENLLAKLNLPSSPTTDLVIKVLMAHGLPLSRELVKELKELLDQLQPGLASEELEPAINVFLLLRNKKVAVTAEERNLLLKFFLGKGDGEEVVYALKLLNELEYKELTYPQLYFVWWQNEFQQGEIYFWTKGNKQKGRFKPWEAVVLHFYTQNLGEIWAKLSKLAGKLTLSLTCENEETLSLFRKNSARLETLLKGAGYDLAGVNYAVGKVDSVFAFDWEEKIPRFRGIDVKV